MSSFSILQLFQLFTFNFFLALAFYKSNIKLNIVLKTPDLARKDGYAVEIHNVVTEDGYILELHRLPCGRIDCVRNFAKTKRPVLILHGLLSSSADWILMGPERSLAYTLVDAGYDVWLGNNRGNIYSRGHTSILPSEKRFWNFSYHELGIYDIPAIIDYILDRTNWDKLYYIGHSQGTTAFWVMMSQKPNYNAKVKLMVGLAPVAFTGNIRGPITKLAKLSYLGVLVGETFGYFEVRAFFTWRKLISTILCQNITQIACNNILFLVTGFTHTNLSATNLTTIMNHIPAGASVKQLIHFGQGYVYPDHFRQYNYENAEKNYQFYKSCEPPEYELNKVTAPVALFSSDNDILSTTMDVDRLKRNLSNIVFHTIVPIKSFGHYDFLWGISSVSNIFVPVLKLLESYE